MWATGKTQESVDTRISAAQFALPAGNQAFLSRLLDLAAVLGE